MNIRAPGYGAAPRPGMSNRPYEPMQGPGPAIPRRGSYQSPGPAYTRPYEDSRDRSAYNDAQYRYHRRPDTPMDRSVFQGGRDGYVPSHVNSRYDPYSRPSAGPDHAHQRRPRPLPGFRRSSPGPSEVPYAVHDPRMPHHPRPRSPPYIREAILPSDYYANLTVINDINRRRKYDQKMARQSAKMANGPPASAPTDFAPVMLFAPRKPSANSSAASSLAASPVGDDAGNERDAKPSEADKAAAISSVSTGEGSFKSPDKMRAPSMASTPSSSVSSGSSKPVIAITTTGLPRTGIRELPTTSNWSASSHSGSAGTAADNSARTGSSLQSVNLQSDVSAISAVEDHSGSNFHGGRTTAARALSLLSAVADETLRADMSAVYRKAEGLNMSSPMRSPREAIRDVTDLNGPLRLQSFRVAPAVEVNKVNQNEGGHKHQQPPDIEMSTEGTDASAEIEASTLPAEKLVDKPTSEPSLRAKSASPGPAHFPRPARDQCTPALSPVIESPMKVGRENSSSNTEAPIELDELEEPGTSTSLRSHMAAELLLGVGDAEVEGKDQARSVIDDNAESCLKNAALGAADLRSEKSRETHAEMEVDVPTEPATVNA